MEKGYYLERRCNWCSRNAVAIHNKNGKGLLLERATLGYVSPRSQSTIKMEKGYYSNWSIDISEADIVAIHNKNGKGLLRTTLS